MGHTIYPMRWIIYEKMAMLKKFSKGLREPEKKIADELISHVYKNISTINYANPIPKDIENNMIFSILLQEKSKGDNSIDDLTLLFFSLLIRHKRKGGEKISEAKKLTDQDESNIYRLLCEE